MPQKKKSPKDILAERDTYLAGWQRAQADYSNLLKETEENRSRHAAYAKQDILEEILPIIDHFEEGLRHIPKDQKKESWVAGIEHIKKQLDDFCERQGLESFGKKGEEFNPEKHEALSQEENEKMEDKVINVVKKGYMLGDRIIRPAQVVVGCKMKVK